MSDNLSPERMKEMENNREIVKSMNIDAVAGLLNKVHNKYFEVIADNVDLKRMVTDVKQENIELRAEVNALKAMGFRGITGHGSTEYTEDDTADLR